MEKDLFNLDSINSRFEYFIKHLDKEYTIGTSKSSFIVSEECMLYYNIMTEYEKKISRFMMREISKGRKIHRDMEEEFIFSLIQTKKGLNILKTYDVPYYTFIGHQFSLIRDNKLLYLLNEF